MPAWMTRRLKERFEEIGRGLGATGRLDPRALRELAGPDWFRGWRRPVLRAVIALGSKPSWNRMLKANGVYAERFARPYATP